MQKESATTRQIASYIFSGSNTMVGVCLTIITLFRIMKTGLQTYADEVLAYDTSIFIIASLLSYIALRKTDNQLIEKMADIFFFTGMIVLFVVGLMIIYTTY